VAATHDALFRWSFADPEHAGPLLRALLPPAITRAIAWDELAPVPGTRVDPGQQRQHSDLLFATRIAGKPAVLYLLLEHKSRPDRWTAMQVLGYMHGIWRDARRKFPRPRHLPFVVPVVVHYGRRRWTATTDLWSLFDSADLPPDLIEALRAATPQFAFTPHDFAARTAAEVRSMALSLHGLWTVACLQFLASVGADEEAVENALIDWADIVRQVLLAPTGQEVFTALQSYILKVTKLTRPRLSLVIERQFGADAMKRILSTWEQAVLEGRTEGRTQGNAEGRAELLLRQLDRRFGPLPPDVATRLAAASTGDLDRWALRVLDARELGEVFAAE